MAPTETTTMIQIERPNPPALVAELSPLVKAAQAFEVTDVETNAIALQRLKALRDGEKKIADYFEPARKAADQAKKEILAARDGLIGPIAAARSMYDQKACTFEHEQRRRAEEEQRRLQEQARKEEEERQLLAAIEAEESGNQEEAAAILDEPVAAPVIAVAPQVARVDGVSSTTRWSAEVVDLLELVKYVAAHPEWISLLEPALPNLNRLAVAQRQALAIPGVRAISKTVRSTR